MAELENPRVIQGMVKILSSLLEALAESNERNHEGNPRQGIVSVFHGLTCPSISVQGYLERIFKYANCSPSCLIIAYVYLDRFARRQPSLPINMLTVHRLLIASVVVAVKFMDDIFYNNAYYAKVGGISTAEMNFLEIDYLFGLGFELAVSPVTFRNYYNSLVGQMTSSECPVGLEASLLTVQSLSPSQGSKEEEEEGGDYDGGFAIVSH